MGCTSICQVLVSNTSRSKHVVFWGPFATGPANLCAPGKAPCYTPACKGCTACGPTRQTIAVLGCLHTLTCPYLLQATEKKAWAGVGRLFSPPRSMTTISHTFKSVYEKLLLPFEEVRNQAQKVACSKHHSHHFHSHKCCWCSCLVL